MLWKFTLAPLAMRWMTVLSSPHAAACMMAVKPPCGETRWAVHTV